MWRLVVVLLALGVAVAGCGGDTSDSSSPASSTTITSGAPTTPPTVTPTTFPADQAAALREIVSEYQNQLGYETLRFSVRNLLLSSVDPTWARFNVAPTPGNERVFQGGYGIAHLEAGLWRVVDFGTSEVGCPPTEIPESVRESLQLGCPPG